MLEDIKYKIGQFEGPLDLLLTLVEKNKMKIEDIEISLICDQYMEYLHALDAFDLEVSAEFLVYAAQLMLIKSRMLLPRVVEEDDPRADLARALLEYKRAKEAAELMKEMYGQFSGRLEKDTDEIPPDRSYVAEHSVYLLSAAMNKLLTTVRYTEKDAEEKVKPLVAPVVISVEGRVYSILRQMIRHGGRADVFDLFEGATTKSMILATFMAMLEMLRDGRLRIDESSVVPYEEKGCYDLSEHLYLILNREKIVRKALESNDGNES